MKVIMIGDLHFGYGNDDPWIEKNIELFFTKLESYMLEHGIKNIIQLGDVFHDRRHITHRSMELKRRTFERMVVENNFIAYVITGNHDAMYKETLQPNAIRELFGTIDNFHVIDKPETFTIGNVDMDFIPWMCKSNFSEVGKFIKESKSKYCFGHFELNGFLFYSNQPSHGIDPSFLKGYDKVYSGHFHTINGSGNVLYAGTPYTITFNDVNEERGFWILDTEGDLTDPEFIPNDNIWHKSIVYPSGEMDYESFRDCRVKVTINEIDKQLPTFQSKMESVVDRIEYIDNFAIKNIIKRDNAVEESDVKSKGTPLEIATAYVEEDDGIEDISKDSIKKMLGALYIQALNEME